MSIALTHFAARAGDHNDRAMLASRLLTEAFTDRLGTASVVIGTPSPAISGGWKEELDAARPDLLRLSSHLDEVFREGAVPVTALSRCAVALATLPVVARHRPDAVVVWFDAHADLHTPGTTDSGYLGGLAFAGPLGLWDSGLGAGLRADNAVLVGVRDPDPAERVLIEAGAVASVLPGPDLAERLRRAIAGRPVYVHIDCDVLEPGIVPTDYAVRGGLTLDELHACAGALAESEVVGIEVGELEARSADDRAPARELVAALSPLLEPFTMVRS
ncbi:arginase family protein [Microbacterium sp. NPDC086615]|jgi:arginase family enzyme|uniref:arginase family protein n=1 Tax=Microbacterium sp. NPDC086615 TaxID=3154865 RepID=UPI003439B2E6|nr:arginase/agmatinase/formiminoglutamase [Microbacterium sp.]